MTKANDSQPSQDYSEFVAQVLEKVPPEHRKQTKEKLRELGQLSDDLSQFAQQVFPSDLWNELPDEEIVDVLVEQSVEAKTENTVLRKLARKYLKELDLPVSSLEESNQYHKTLTLGLQTSLLEEFLNRGTALESPAGRALLNFVVEETEENREKLVEFAKGQLDWHSQYPSKPDADEEITSMAHQGLVERLTYISNSSEQFRQHLTAFITGQYSRIPENVRKSIKEQLEGIRDKSVPSVSIDAGGEEADSTSQRQDRILREHAFAEGSLRDQRALIESYRHHPMLTAEDKELLDLVYLEGYSQKEIAVRQNRSQSAVSQHLKRIGLKINK